MSSPLQLNTVCFCLVSFVVGLCLDILVLCPLRDCKWTCLSLSFILPQLYCKLFMSPACRNEKFSFFYHVPMFQRALFFFFLFFKHNQNPPHCTPQQIPAGSLKHPRNSFLLQRLTMVPIMKKYVQEMGDCHRSHGNFILINLGQKLAARASRHSSRLPEVDPIFCLNRH